MEQSKANAKIAELKAELASTWEYQRATAEILHVISTSSVDLQPVLDMIVERAARLCKAEASFIWRLKQDGLRVAAMHAINADFAKFARENPPPLDRCTAAGRSVLDNRTVHIPNVEEDPDYSWRGGRASKIGKYKTALGVPLSRGGEPFGAIALLRNTATPFSKEEISLVATFASQSVIAIENARLFEAEQERTKELQNTLDHQTAISSVLGVISRSPGDFQAVADAIAMRASVLCNAAMGSVTRFDGKLIHLVSTHNVSEGKGMEAVRGAFPRSPTQGGAVDQVIRTGSIINIPDVTAEGAYAFPAQARDIGFRSILAVPMLNKGTTLGIVTVYGAEADAFEQRHIDLLKAFADQAVIAIENTRLFEAEQERTKELQNTLDHQTAISSVLGVISRSPNELQPVLDEIAATARRLCRAESAFIMRFDADDGRLHLVAGSAVATETIGFVAANPSRPDRHSISGRVFLERQIVHVVDSTADPELTYADPSRDGGAHVRLGVPMLRDGEFIGAIVLARWQREPFTEREIGLVATFADQAVVAIENARLFNETKAALERQTATAEILKVIASSPSDVQPVFDAIVESAARIFAPCVSGIVMREGDMVNMRSLAGESKVDHTALAKIYPRPFSADSSATRAMQSRQIVQIPDTEASDAPKTSRAGGRAVGIRSVTAAPLLRGREGIGSIHIFSPTPGYRLSDKQLSLLQTFADQAVIAIENVRLFNETREALEGQTALAEVLAVISNSVEDTQPVFDKILDSCQRLIDCSDLAVLTVEADSLVHVRAVRGPHGLIAAGNYRPVPVKKSVIVRAVLDGNTVHVPDALAGDNVPETICRLAAKTGNHSCLVTPLIWQDRPIGAIYITRSFKERQWPTFTDKDISLLETFADQAVIAIQNSRLFHETTEALEYQTATSDVLTSIAQSATDSQPVFDAIVSNAARLCDAEFSSILLYDGEKMHLGSLYNMNEEVAALQRARYPMAPDRSQISGRAILSSEIVQVADVKSDPEYPQELAEAGDWRSVMSVPLISSAKPIGAIFVAKAEPVAFSERQVGLVSTFARQAVIAIENARLFEAEQERTQELRESLEYQTATSDVLTAIAQSATESQPVFDAIVSNAARLCNAQLSSIYLLNDEDILFPVALHNLDDKAAAIAMATSSQSKAYRDQLIARRVVDSKSVIEIEDILKDENYPKELALAGGFRAVTGVPLSSDGRAIGAVCVAKKVPGKFDRRQIDLVETFARQAAIAIENARLFNEVQERTRELTQTVGELEALSRIGRVVSSTLDLEEVLQTVLENATRMAGAGGGAIYVFDSDSDEFVLAAGHSMSEEHIARVRSQPIRLGDPIVGECARLQRAIQVEDLEKYDGEATPLIGILMRVGVRSVLAIPLLHHNNVIGALIIRRNYAGQFAPETIQLLEAFAAQSAIAVNNARLFKAVEETGRALAAASEHKSQFLANMSHELRTPLNAILGYTELIQDGIYGEPEKKVSDVLSRVQSNGKHLLGLINDVLDLSKIEAGQVELTRDGYSLSDAIQTVVAATESLATEKKLELKTNVGKNLPAGVGDERRLVQVLLNLVGNAIKFTDEGSVTVSAAEHDGRFSIAVSDTGPGIPEEELSRIFEEFHQVDSSATKRKGGTGLGLAISKRIVELHGGTLTVASEVGVGSTFRVELPIRLSKQ